MLDWNEYRSEVMQRVGDLGKLTPETLRKVRISHQTQKNAYVND